MKTGVFLQARLSSSRLPGKALLSLSGMPVLAQVMRSLKGVGADVHALLTDTESLPHFTPLALAAGFKIFEGPLDDVLARFCLAADCFDVTRIIRATGDNPLVSARLANLHLRLHEKHAADLSRFRGAPIGTGVEVVETAALKRALTLSADPVEREHCTTFLLRRRDEYRVLEFMSPRFALLPDVHVSLDTEKDYLLLQKIYNDLYSGKPITVKRLVRWLKKNAVA